MTWTDCNRGKDRKSELKRPHGPENSAEAPAGAATGKEKIHRKMCAWCGLVLQQGMEPASHGICGDCVAFFFEEFQIAEDPLIPFCEVCAGPYDSQKCLLCRFDRGTGGTTFGKTMVVDGFI